jgi:hypothetical protein
VTPDGPAARITPLGSPAEVTWVDERPDKRDGSGSDLSTTGRELYELLVAYARQETTEPLRGLGRYMGFGALGSVLVALGSTLLVIGVLRVLQTETGTTFTGNWSWVPYLVTLVAAAVVIALAVMGISRSRTPGEKAARQPDPSDRKEH